MAIERTVKITMDAEEALKRLDALEKNVKELGETSKKTEKSANSIAKGFKGVGLAFKGIGISIVLKAFDRLSESLMQNEAIADTVETVFNSIGVAFKLVTDAIVGTINAVSKSSENFDALGRIAKNVLDISLTPLKLAFQGIKLGIQSAMLAFEKSMFGGKDADKIEKLTADINATKASIKEAGEQAIQSGKEIVVDFKEGVDEVKNIGKVAVDSFKETFEGVTVEGIIQQGKAITETRKNYELLALQQQRLVEQFDREAEILRQQRDDTTLTIEQRIEANEKLADVLLEQNQAEQDAIDAQIQALNDRIKLEGDSQQLRNEIFALETEKLAVQAKVTGFQSEQLLNQNALLQEQKDLDEEIATKRQTRLDLETQAAELGLEFAKNISDERLAILVDEAQKELKITEAKIAADKALRVGAAKDILSSVSQLAGEGTQIAKATALTSILIDTARGISGAIAAGAGLVFPANLGAIATGVASVLSGIAQAKAVFKKVGGGGNLDTPDNVQTAVAEQGVGALTPNIEAIDQPQLGSPSPVQAFVVENEISNAQALQEELDLQATL